jgi:hypothetical protein
MLLDKTYPSSVGYMVRFFGGFCKKASSSSDQKSEDGQTIFMEVVNFLLSKELIKITLALTTLTS